MHDNSYHILEILFLRQKSVTKMVVEIIVEAKVKAEKWVAMSVLGITLPLPLFVIPMYKIQKKSSNLQQSTTRHSKIETF